MRPNGARGSLTTDAIDSAGLTEQIEGRGRAYLIDVRRVRQSRNAARRIRVPWSMLITALDSLELMLRGGARINTALRTLAECAPQRGSRRFWIEVVRSVEETGQFGESLRGFPNVFNDSMIGIIIAHEESGRLNEGVRYVRDYVAHMQAIRRESIRGLTYPAIVCAAGLCASIVICVFTLPRFSQMLKDVGATKTNRITEFFFGVSDFVLAHPVLTGLAFLAPFAGIWMALRPRFRPAFDRALFLVPVVRRAIEALALARICVTFRALSSSGIRVVEALEACRTVAGNVIYKMAISRVIAALRENSTIGAGFEEAGIFPPEVVLAVKSGEGSLPDVFDRLGEYYSVEAKNRVGIALGMLEPVMLLFVLAWVLCIALAVVLPVVEVMNEIH